VPVIVVVLHASRYKEIMEIVISTTDRRVACMAGVEQPVSKARGNRVNLV
jgi:hypothetical protein